MSRGGGDTPSLSRRPPVTTERQKMLAGEMYDPFDPELVAARAGPGPVPKNGAVIGAGSVVTRDVPDGVFAAGNPCRVIREITE